jgi:hypothetical protein
VERQYILTTTTTTTTTSTSISSSSPALLKCDKFTRAFITELRSKFAEAGLEWEKEFDLYVFLSLYSENELRGRKRRESGERN